MQENGATLEQNPVEDQDFTDSFADEGKNSQISGGPDLATPPKRGRGRPPKPDDGEKRKPIKYFPPPPRKVVGSQKEFPQELFLKYFRRVAADKELAHRVAVYVYRTFPIINSNPPAEFVNSDEAAAKRPKYIDCTSQPFESEEDIFNRYGAGDYKLFLNDVEHRGPSKTQMVCYFAGSREWDKYPPAINLSELVLTDPKNQSYIRYLQQKGLMPRPEDQGEEDDMANVEVVREMASTVDKLTTKLMNQSDRAAPPAAPRSPQEIDVSNTVRALTDSFSQASKAQLDMITSAVDKATGVTARTQDPFETLDKIMRTIREMFPAQNTDALEAALRRSDLLEQKLDALTQTIKDRQIEDLQAQLVAARQAQSAQPARDPLTQAREFAALQTELKSIFGAPATAASSDDEDRPSREPWYAKHMPMFLGAASFLVTGIASIVHNQAVARTGKGNATPPPQPPPELMPPQMAHAAAAIAGAPQQESMNQVQLLITAIKVPLSRALDSGQTGHDFAEWFADSYGDLTYEQVRQQGAAAVLASIQTYAPDLFAKLQQVPERAQQFIDQFIAGPEDGQDVNN